MSVKSFKFVSPGVFINEIDNSFRPRTPENIGPVVIGRAARGPAMQPIKVESYSEFVEVFGDTVPGNAGGDVYRYGNYQTPMYGTYAAKAFLNSNVAPLTYIRLLGTQADGATGDGIAGWETSDSPAPALENNGGAYGLWIFKDSDKVGNVLGTGQLAAVWYLDSASSVLLSGAYSDDSSNSTASVGAVIGVNSNKNYVVEVTSSGVSEKYEFNFRLGDSKFARGVFNTNPQLGNTGASDFYNSDLEKKYFLGETFEQELVDAGLTEEGTSAVILPIAQATATSVGPHKSREGTREAQTGWIIGQDLGEAPVYDPQNAQELFYFVGRGHGEWLSKNVKISIQNVKPSNTRTSEYGSFSVVIRSLGDTDSRVSIIERFDNLNLDPTSENFIARKIGNMYMEWNESERRIRHYGEYPNQSKFIRVVMNEAVEDGAADAKYLPFGYQGPKKYADVSNWSGGTLTASDYIYSGSVYGLPTGGYLATSSAGANSTTASFAFPSVRLRVSSSDGGLPDQKNAYFGMQTTQTSGGTRPDASVADPHRYWPGTTEVAYYFSLDDLIVNTDGSSYYEEGSRAAGTSRTATSGSDFLIEDDGYNRFTTPMYGGFDGFDIFKPDPMFNLNMGSNQTTDYRQNTYRRAIDTVADPEFADMNLLAVPGLTNTGLTAHMIDVCEERADAMAIIDLPNVYKPFAEGKVDNRRDRVTGNASQAAQDIRTRQIDSSYGATFFPWVQTQDAPSGQLLWIPPSVAMMGVLASSERQSQVWFAPAGFNRGGLSDGAAGIPVSNVTQRLTSKERDTLYEARINPIASFPSSGIVVFGQKTLQERPSALDRINVRRLVIYLKKQISILSTQILFEQNVQATWNRFKGLVEPFLANVKTQFGISDYRLILDESTTTPDLIDQNIMYAKIMVKPARAIEYIAIDFVVASTGASFDD